MKENNVNINVDNTKLKKQKRVKIDRYSDLSYSIVGTRDTYYFRTKNINDDAYLTPNNVLQCN